MSPRPWIVALALGVGSFAGAGLATSSAAPAEEAAGPLTTLFEPPTTDPPTTAAPTTATTRPTPTTARSTTTTARPTATTSPPATTAPTVDDESTSSTDLTATTEPSTTSSVPLLVDGPPIDPEVGGVAPTTTAVAVTPVASTDDGRTSRQVTFAVIGLLLLAVVFASLTYWYWRHTKPRVAPVGAR